MGLYFEKWRLSLICGIVLLHLCLAALPTNGAQDLDNLAVQEQTTPTKPSPLNSNRVFNRAIRPQPNVPAQRLNSQQKSLGTQPKLSTTTPVVEEVEEKEREENAAESQISNEDDSVQQQEEVVSSTTSSTEASRRPLVGVVRPFRSNNDLIESLKRRRQKLKQHGSTIFPLTSPNPTSSEKPSSKPAHLNRKAGNLNVKSFSPSTEQSTIGSHKKVTPSRRFNTKFLQVSSTTPALSEDAISEESDNVVSQPPSRSSRNYLKNRRIS